MRVASSEADELVDWLNDLATSAQLPAYMMTRTEDEGDPFSVAEFNEFSGKLAYLSANAYVQSVADPDGFVDYAQVTVSTTGQITARRLTEATDALARMVYIRKDVTWTPNSKTQVTVTHATASEAASRLCLLSIISGCPFEESSLATAWAKVGRTQVRVNRGPGRPASRRPRPEW